LAAPASGARPCSQNRNRPPGFSTRFASASAADGDWTEHRVKVQTTQSKLSLSKGSASAVPAWMSTLRPSGRSASMAKARSSAEGSTPDTLVTFAGS
jgi:hypothetical protein